MGIRRKNASEIADRIPGVDTERVRELALNGYMPCEIGDDGEPYFKVQESTSWAKENLYERSEGRDLNREIRVSAFSNTAPTDERPPILSHINQLEKYNHSPYPPCVYFLTRDSEVIYIGKSHSLPNRVQVHHKKGRDFDDVFYIRLPKGALDEVEKALIEMICPPENNQRYPKAAKGEKYLVNQGIITISAEATDQPITKSE